MVAVDENKNIIGVATWEEADVKDVSAGHSALLLHGLYVNPEFHRQCVGSELYGAAEQAVIEHGCMVCWYGCDCPVSFGIT